MSTETELEILKTVVSKLDVSLEKMTNVSNDIGKILAVHETRIDSLERVADNRTDDIKELHSRITTSFREMSDQMRAMEERLEIKYQKQQINATEQHNQIQKEIQHDIDDISKRLQKLENWRWWMMGLGVGFGVVIAKIFPMLAG